MLFFLNKDSTFWDLAGLPILNLTETSRRKLLLIQCCITLPEPSRWHFRQRLQIHLCHSSSVFYIRVLWWIIGVVRDRRENFLLISVRNRSIIYLCSNILISHIRNQSLYPAPVYLTVLVHPKVSEGSAVSDKSVPVLSEMSHDDDNVVW